MRAGPGRSIPAAVVALVVLTGCSGAQTSCSEYLSATSTEQESLARRALSDHNQQALVPMAVVADDVRYGCLSDPGTEVGAVLTRLGAPDESSFLDRDNPTLWIALLVVGGAYTYWRRHRDHAAAEALASGEPMSGSAGSASGTPHAFRHADAAGVDVDDLPHHVLTLLRDHGPLDIDELAAQLGRRYDEIDGAVRSLESAEQAWVDASGRVRSGLDDQQ